MYQQDNRLRDKTGEIFKENKSGSKTKAGCHKHELEYRGRKQVPANVRVNAILGNGI